MNANHLQYCWALLTIVVCFYVIRWALHCLLGGSRWTSRRTLRRLQARNYFDRP